MAAGPRAELLDAQLLQTGLALQRVVVVATIVADEMYDFFLLLAFGHDIELFGFLWRWLGSKLNWMEKQL